ncbi:MAG: helix-turn-helix domain-containing protein [Clostridia bacterium]|nr:helix-turn-helix domain-containing protein [Clostridia bacterium]
MDYIARLKRLKEERGLTNAEIAELSQIPLSTVKRIFSGGDDRHSDDHHSFHAITAITVALGGSLDDIAGIKSPEERMQSPQIENVISNYADLLKGKDDLLAEKDARLAEKNASIDSLRAQRDKERKEKHWLAWFFAGFVSVVLAVLFYDMLNGHMGYIRY